MRRNSKISNFITPTLPTRLCLGVLATGVFMLLCQPVFADDDLFQHDIGRWMSFGHYKDAEQRDILKTIDPPAVAERQDANQAQAQTPAVEQPSRPVDLPIMPGLNKGFDVRLDTTDEDYSTSNSPVIDPNAPSNIHPSDKNWLSLDEATKAKNNGDSGPALNVRLSALPSTKITPIPGREKASAQRKGDVAMEKNTKELQALKTDDAAIAASIKAYKKQQLEALQSDRQTLKALQDAVSSLGLEKQLGFVTGQNGNLPDTFPAKSVDLPVPDTTSK